jgi:histidinol phosphatase-like enzyme (inositol monophosphatase family)
VAASAALLTEAAALAERMADTARSIARKHFRQAIEVERKSDLSPVTIADREVETALRNLLRERFPEHAILGEEYGSSAGAKPGDAEYTWVIDPIDGTQSFVCGLPLFGCLIALLHGQKPVLGIIEMPALGERWLGLRGTASTLNAKPARTSACASLAQARLFTTSPDMFDAISRQRFDKVSARAALRRYGGDCYSYGLLASGHCDLVVEAGLKPYDYLALVPVIEGAGGVITDWNGRALGLESDGRVVAAASTTMLHQTLEALA